MQLKWLAIPIISACAVLSYAPAANAYTLMPFDEPTVQLVTSNPLQSAPIGPNSAYALQPVTANPLLCSNTSAPPLPNIAAVSPIYYSSTGLASQKPFVFGASALTPSVPSVAIGATFVYGSPMTLGGDPSMVCYGLDANGVHGPTPGVMRDEFEGVNHSPTLNADFNSSVVLTVFHVPTGPSDYYGYTVDVSIPAAPANKGCGTSTDCNFALLEGFDTSIFDTAPNADHSAGWCLAGAGATSCPGSANAGGINLNYTNFNVNGLPSLAAGLSDATYRFVVKRYFKSGVTALPASGAPVAIAALFSPFDMDENFIGDNVAVGTKDLPNTAPAVVATGEAWTTFTNGLASLVENTDSNTLSFSATDADTQGAITASVTLNLPGGISVPVAQTNCSPATPPSGQQSAANCTLAIPLSNAAWWNASVASGYDGLFNALATDATNGTYAPGVSASARVVVSDALGKPSAPVTVPIHIFSSVNNKPVASYSSAFVMATDPQSNHVYPTMSCSVSQGGGAGGCGAVDRFGSIQVDVLGSITALPGPAAAFDELATQGTAVVDYSDPQDAFTNVQCNRQQQEKIFSTNGGPIVAVSGGATLYDMNFVISGTPPASTVGAICTLTITDVGPFPNSESAMTSSSQFRLVVNP